MKLTNLRAYALTKIPKAFKFIKDNQLKSFDHFYYCYNEWEPCNIANIRGKN